ncbi:MAG TPA: phosphatase PAP2 family protein [Frankiaceae bacterium]|nr:phosphatase PAP2 family protein [Frankiaceae bacterium]
MLKRLHEADLALYKRIALSPSPEPVDRAWAHFTHAADHSKLWFVTAAALSTRGRPGRRAALRGVMALGITSAVANQVGKRLFNRKRPDYLTMVEVARLPHRHPVSGSFPSGHSASAAAFAVAVASEMPKMGLPLGAAAAAVGYSRVHTGVHYPGDVLAGWALGAGLAYATRWWWPLAPVDPTLVRERLTPTKTTPAPQGKGVTIVVNAAAGPDSAVADDIAADIRDALPQAEVIALDEPDQLTKTLEHAAGHAVAIGVRGGDGSVNAAAEVAYDAGKPLAVLPGGTLNHLARDIGVSSLEDVARGVEAGCTVEMDVAEIDGRPFLNTASFGSYAELVDARERLEDRIGKWPALVVALTTVLRGREPVEVEIDGRRQRIWAIFVGNCRYEPAGFAPAYRPEVDDGLLDVRVVHAGHPFARTRLLLAVLTGTLARSRVYEQRFASEITVRSDESLRLARDGETFDGAREFTVRKRPRRLTVFVPPAD